MHDVGQVAPVTKPVSPNQDSQSDDRLREIPQLVGILTARVSQLHEYIDELASRLNTVVTPTAEGLGDLPSTNATTELGIQLALDADRVAVASQRLIELRDRIEL